MKDNVLIITGCMHPKMNVPALKISNYEERKKQYLNSIMYYIEHSDFDKIIYADNSGEPANHELCECAKLYKKELEWLSFTGDSNKVETFGKGYGEGEIISYVMKNSKIIKNVHYMTKITGRLIIKNINLFCRLANKEKIYFQPSISEDRRLYINTRLYMMPISVYKRYFFDAYKRVNDREQVYLEHTFGLVVKDNSLKYNHFIVYPNYQGKSGSTGITYNSRIIKRLINTVRMYCSHTILHWN